VVSLEESGNEDFYERCLEVVTKTLGDNHWDLIQDIPAFTRLVKQETEARIANGVTKSEHAIIVDSTIYCYAVHLYTGCLSTDESFRQAAYEALGRYIDNAVWRALQSYVEVPGYSSEDLRHEVLEKVIAGIHKIEDPGYFIAWVRTMVWRRVKDLAVRRHEENVSDDELDTHPTPLIISYENDIVRQLDEAIHHCLPPGKQRTVIRAFFLADMTIKEIADQFDMTPNQVRDHKFKGLARLRKCNNLTDLLETLRN
jgi:RNA polymerase sigma factor (sigma-70 family)